MKPTLTLCLCLALAAAPMALAETPPETPPEMSPDTSPSLAMPLGPEVPFTDEVFTLIAVNGQPAPYSADISFAGGRVAGQGPCNRFFGALTYDATQLRIDNIGSTRMACPDLAHEAEFFALLDKVRQADRREGQIALLDNEGAALLYFTIARP